MSEQDYFLLEVIHNVFCITVFIQEKSLVDELKQHAKAHHLKV